MPSLQVFFDGACPICWREVALLRRLDLRGRIEFTDIAAPGFEAPPDRTQAELMGSIHARLPDGAWVDGVETFRRIYAALGLGPLVALTRLPGLSHGLDAAYRLFAKNRLRLTGRGCEGDVCAVSRPRATTARPAGGAPGPRSAPAPAAPG